MSICEICAAANLKSIVLQKVEAGAKDYPAAFQYRKLGPVRDIRAKSEFCVCCRWIHSIILRAHARRKTAALYNLQDGTLVECNLANPWSETMIGYRRLASEGSAAEVLRERVSWLELETLALEDRGDYHFSNNQLYVPHAIQWCELPIPTVSAFCAAQTAEEMEHRRFSGRYVDSELCPPALFGVWLDLCRRVHGDLCEKPTWLVKLSRPKNLKVIDVQRRALVDIDQDSSYATLSYVWGKLEVLQLLKNNIDKLSQDGALTQENGVAAVVMDAMEVTAAIGERYLWVDALCIVQDDYENKMNRIRQMERVYGGALLTIAAACGRDANTQLPGVRSGSREPHQEIITFGDYALISGVVNLKSSLEFSTWNKRGWTLQEKLLSRRCLRFDIDQLFWECQCDSWCEETALETHSIFDGSRPLRGLLAESGRQYQAGHPLAPGDAFTKYTELVQDYTYRELTFEADILNAFTGILRALAINNDEEFLFALPESHFDWALLWESQGRQRDQKKDKTSFPSWSWLSWQGLIIWWAELMRKPTECPVIREITWYSLGTDGSARMITSREEIHEHGHDKNELLRSQWRNSSSSPPNRTLSASSAEFIDSGIIGAYTSHAHVRLKIDHDTGKAIIHNDVGLEIGSLSWSHKPWEAANDDRNDDLHELMVLSRRNIDLFGGEDRPTLNVMLVARQEDGGAVQRITVGTVDEEEWIKLERSWNYVEVG